MTRPRLLDLFCGAGGAAMGYHRAGFDVTGVDIEPQPHYPFDFLHADALEVLGIVAGGHYGSRIDAIHASPPCQAFTQMSNRWRGKAGKADAHLDLLTPTLSVLRQLPFPYVVENVPGAKHSMRATLTLHGGMFGLRVNRPRLFESNILILAPDVPAATETIGVYGKAPDGRLLWAGKHREQHAASSLTEAQAAMGMPWADWRGVKEAVPPTYTEFIGAQLMAHLREVAA